MIQPDWQMLYFVISVSFACSVFLSDFLLKKKNLKNLPFMCLVGVPSLQGSQFQPYWTKGKSSHNSHHSQ